MADYHGKSETITCKRCHKSHLHWENVDGKWKLYHRDTLHKCKRYIPDEVRAQIAANKIASRGNKALDKEFRDRLAP